MVAVLLVGGVLALAPAVWSWLDPLSPARAAERVLAVLNTWNGIRDFVAQVAVRGPEGEILARVSFLTPAHLRVDILAPEGLADETFALRPVPEGWLFVHHRPWIDLGIEARIRADELEHALNLPTVAQLWEGLRRGRIRASYLPAPPGDALGFPPSDEFDLSGVPGPFPRVVLRVDPASLLPRDVLLYAEATETPALEIHVHQLMVNVGLELRDLFRLDPPPTRWLGPTPGG